MQLSFAIDRGGTFTDVFAYCGDSQRTTKLLSVSPHYADAPSEGIRRLLSDMRGEEVSVPIPTEHIREIRMGTTVATNALLEHAGQKIALVVTRGFADVLEIGTQARAKLFDLAIEKPKSLVQCVIEADERLQISKGKHGKLTAEVVAPLAEEALRGDLLSAYQQGITSVAISLVHSYLNPCHEIAAARIAAEIGFTSISVSSKLAPIVKYYPRTMTTVVNAYLAPIVTKYIESFKQQFAGRLEGVPLLFMQSDGGLVHADAFDAYRAVLSGPAGGVAGCCAVQRHCGITGPAVGFDMGGTSTDVCRCVDGTVETIRESVIAGVVMQSPQVDVNTVAAGGGSVLKWVCSMFVVGPESAGALPGPACYGRGGPLTITDANVMLGRVRPEFMPKIFGPDGKQEIDVVAVRTAFAVLTATVNKDCCSIFSATEVAQFFVDTANEQMCRPIRMLTEGKGYATDEHSLISFGGAGGQHAVDVARRLRIRRVFVHRHTSIMSAVGIGTAPEVSECLVPWGTAATADTTSMSLLLAEMARATKEEHLASTEYIFTLRFDGTSTQIAVPIAALKRDDVEDLRNQVNQKFMSLHEKQFGFLLSGRRIIVDDVRIRTSLWASNQPFAALSPESNDLLPSEGEVDLCCRGQLTRGKLFRVVDGAQGKVSGPALLFCRDSVVVLDDACCAAVHCDGSMLISVDELPTLPANRDDMPTTATVDPLELTVFSHRFMSIAEQMGTALQQTAVSTNIKERLDFSCAIFDNDAGLVANAPHIPVHLGAMGATVAFQKKLFEGDWPEGDVVVCNHPANGGSHLPDITVITPVFADGALFCFVACRAHHSDVGGTTPGSMPPFSRTLIEEGAIIDGFKLVKGGVFDEAGVTELLMTPGSVPGCSGCRAINDVLSDLKAQVAANQRGVLLIRQLISTSSPANVLKYMSALQDASEMATRELIKRIATDRGDCSSADDQMDDGTPVRLRIEMSKDTGSATFDFTGTGRQVYGSTNCPPQVVRSAILYSLRCLMKQSVLPLNEGCMRPVTVKLPPNSILSPARDAAIVAGNVLTSQRITDVILLAFGAAANSQGDMNNFTFGGGSSPSYYETICGGSGAGPGFNGASAVHTHMTNTRITDVEWLEARFPVLLREFAVRRGTGGKGRWSGGDGVIRSFMFLDSVTACLLSERRAIAPNGLFGGLPAAKGVNLFLQASRWASGDRRPSIQQALRLPSDHPEAVSVGSKATLQIQPFDIVTIMTPGGGGCEAP